MTGTFDLKKAKAHIRGLMLCYDLIRVDTHLSDAYVDIKAGIVFAPSVRDEETYAVLLHEIGHVVTFRRGQHQIEMETLAWQWAKKTAVQWTRTMTEVVRESLETYLISRRNKLMPLGHPIYTLSGISRKFVIKWRNAQ